MPKIPTWLANAVEKFISDKIHLVEIVKTEMISQDIKQITFKGDFFTADFAPGQEALFRINEHEYRHYTLSAFDKENGTCEILFYLNGKGEGSAWAKNLKIGESLKLIADKGKIKYDYEANQHFFFGDETSIGLYEWFKNVSQNLDHEYFGILEMQEENEESLRRIKLLLDAVPASQEEPASNAINWMDNMHPKCWEMWKDAKFYLSGRSRSVQKFKKYLRQKGVATKQITSIPYWEIGVLGL
ncbi:siderophore-interacting protein [Pedobacter nototheniae]|uniref:siderophore-interacting protein n=1 Tax=Pedobacter nototheniae TaxID=2488994 RepID=UPI00292F45F9|nr:siderophore-interacting protein [Pedobacter nototheniae]